MCGRYILASPLEALEAQFGAAGAIAWEPRYNIAPSTPVPVVRRGPSGRIIALHTWGLVPAWTRDPAQGPRPANARAETVVDKPSFRGPFRERRCVLPADGFYEWRGGTPKQAFCIRAAQGGMLALAGLWDRWEGESGPLETCTILTTAANGAMAPIHARMPVILDAREISEWLDPFTPQERLLALLRPCPDAWLRLDPVGPAVGKVGNEGPGLMEPLEGFPEGFGKA